MRTCAIKCSAPCLFVTCVSVHVLFTPLRSDWLLWSFSPATQRVHFRHCIGSTNWTILQRSKIFSGRLQKCNFAQKSRKSAFSAYQQKLLVSCYCSKDDEFCWINVPFNAINALNEWLVFSLAFNEEQPHNINAFKYFQSLLKSAKLVRRRNHFASLPGMSWVQRRLKNWIRNS